VYITVLKARLTHLAIVAALVLPAFLGKMGGLGFHEGSN
jgi:hypothetical protein